MILVDAEDEWLLEQYAWRLIAKGYAATSIGQQNVYLHHVILGQPIDGSVVDHINRNKQDNRRSNLRYASLSENQLNSPRSDDAHLISVTPSGKYQVQMQRNKVRRVSKSYATLEEAIKERDTWLQETRHTQPVLG